MPMIRRTSILIPILTVLLTGSLLACSVPVFRYAFEHWHPDSYLVMVFHRGELTETQQALLAELQPPADAGASAVNLVVKTVDLDADPGDPMTSLWVEQETEILPWVVVKTPPKQGVSATMWAGELEDQNISQLLASPMRQQLQERLLDGDSVVWMFLDSGHKQADDAGYEVLQAEVERLQQVLELPEIEAADLYELSLAPDELKLKMSSLRVSRDDPAERFLVEMLLRVEPDLRDEQYVHQPMAFPVFGRGRALYALIGNGITPDTIEVACRFLTGACQCTVKAQNPGVDLLMSVNWDLFIQPALPYDTTPPTLAGLGGFTEPEGPSSTNPIGTETSVGGGTHSGSGSDAVSETDRTDRAEQMAAGSAQDQASASLSTVDMVMTGTETNGTPTNGTPSNDTKDGTPLVKSTPPPSLAGNVLLVMGLLAMCVLVVSMVLIPRSR